MSLPIEAVLALIKGPTASPVDIQTCPVERLRRVRRDPPPTSHRSGATLHVNIRAADGRHAQAGPEARSMNDAEIPEGVDFEHVWAIEGAIQARRGDSDGGPSATPTSPGSRS